MEIVHKGGKRWGVAIAGTVLQAALGTVYAWSFFQKPLVTNYGWSNVQVMWIFSLAICALGFAAAMGGRWMPVVGPRKLAVSGAALYGLGYLISAWALRSGSLFLLYLGFGLVGGAGLGLGYVTPVATAAKWFPDKKGFVTGMVIMGFGLGALLMSKIIAPMMLGLCQTAAGETDMAKAFAYIGVALLVIGLPSAWMMQNPPEFVLAGKAAGADLNAGRLFTSSRFIRMWLLLFLNTSAGIMFIGLQSPMLQGLLSGRDPELLPDALAAAGATLIAVSSVFNGLGRFFWGGLSDRIGRTMTFRLLFVTQIFVFLALIWTGNPWVFGVLVCYVLLCYGGGFGTMPSYVGDVYGAKLMPLIYGGILTAWSMAGIAGPQLAAWLRDHGGNQAAAWTYGSGAGLLLLGLIVAFTLHDRALEH